MENEQEHESADPGETSETAPERGASFSPSLMFPRYVVTEVYRRIQLKLGLSGIRSDDDLAWTVQRRLPVSAIDNLTLHASWDVREGDLPADRVAECLGCPSREA